MSEKRAEFYEQVGVAATCRGYEEYERMFALPPELEGKKLLDIAGGASSFAADCFTRGIEVTAIDPRYSLPPELMLADARAEIETSTEKLRKLSDRLDWEYYGSVDRHREGRLKSFARFAADYTDPNASGRYVSGSLPSLPVADNTYDYVLCSHFLFLYADQFNAEFHEQALMDMIRVCRPGGQIRVYPLMSLRWEPYPHMERILEAIRSVGAAPRFEESGLPFIPGSNKLLVVDV